MSSRIVKTFIFILSVVTVSTFSKFVLAADLTVTCDPSLPPECSSNPAGVALFYTTNIYPGWNDSKIVRAVNNYSDNRDFMLQVSSAGGLSNVLTLTISENGGPVLWSGTITQLHNSRTLVLSNILSHSNKEFSFSLLMDTSAGNEYQSNSLDLDFNFGFIQESIQPQVEKPSKRPVFKSSGDAKTTSVSPIILGVTNAASAIADKISNIIPSSEVTAPAVLVSEINANEAPNVLGDSVCADVSWWWLLFVLQFVLLWIFIKKPNYVTQFFVGIVFALIFWKNFCPWWDWVLSVFITLFWLFVFLKKKSRT